MAKSLHERRKITFAELGALYGVLGMIKNKMLVHTETRYPVDNQHGFNMAIPCKVVGCGSVGCIGGTMALIMGMDQMTAMRYVGVGWQTGTHSEVLRPLFFLNVVIGDKWDKITLSQAAKAIHNFLKTGKPQWKKVLTRKRHV